MEILLERSKVEKRYGTNGGNAARAVSRAAYL